jgi:glycosyltransferase involved in cell wall biosynthesis
MLLLSGPSPDRVGAAAATLRWLRRGLDGDALPWALHATDKPAPLPLRFAGRLPGGLRVAVDFNRRLAQERPRLVHLCFASEPDGWGLREASVHVGLARRAGARVALQLLGRDLAAFLRRRPVQREVFRALLNDADALIVGSATARAVLAELDAPPERVHLVPPGLEASPYGLPEDRVPTRHRPLRLVALGANHRKACLQVLVEGLGRAARARGPRVAVELIGRVPTGWDGLAEAAGAAGVRALGELAPDEVPLRLQAADGVVLLDPGDAPPWSALEAMAACRPVIAAAHGGIPELLADDAGELFAPDDPAALAQALLRWVDDADRRLDLGAAGWHRVQQRHGLGASMDAYHTAWASALGVAPAALSQLLGAPRPPAAPAPSSR